MEEEIKSVIEKNKYGITEHELLTKLENYTNEEIIKSLCKMESDGKIEKYSNRGTIKYRLVQLSQEESEDLINKLIIQSDTAGITLNELKNKSNLPQAMVNKCIKNLQHKLLVKMVKSHKNNQKLFISFEKMPSEEITGGKWFTEGEIDEQFVNELMKVIYLFINNKTKGELVRIRLLPTIKEIKEFITESKVTNIFLNEEDVKSLLDVMVAEGKVQEIEKENTLFYRTFY